MRRPVHSALIRQTSITLGKANRRGLEKVLRELDATAVLAFSDMIAWETIAALRDAGLRVPEDISVIGFDNIQSKYPFPVRLTSVSSSKTTMARQASTLLLRILDDRTRPSEQIVLQTRLVSRDTASAPQKH